MGDRSGGKISSQSSSRYKSDISHGQLEPARDPATMPLFSLLCHVLFVLPLLPGPVAVIGGNALSIAQASSAGQSPFNVANASVINSFDDQLILRMEGERSKWRNALVGADGNRENAMLWMSYFFVEVATVGGGTNPEDYILQPKAVANWHNMPYLLEGGAFVHSRQLHLLTEDAARPSSRVPSRWCIPRAGWRVRSRCGLYFRGLRPSFLEICRGTWETIALCLSRRG